jgi:AcrR family transcriptional regulator
MSAGAVATDTRSRLLETALKLFAERGVEGTSLQMIADELGVTKAAVYYHFKTKDEIVEAVVAPLLAELNQVVHEARARRSRGAQIDQALAGFVDLIVRHRTLQGLLTRDPGIMRAVKRSAARSPMAHDSRAKLNTVLAGPDPTPEDLIMVSVLIKGLSLAGGGPEHAGIDDDTLRRHLLEAGRRLLGRPRRRA